ncbi:gamma-glutamyltransferase family protein [Croceicoccus ponticola]|uniref:Gamma-glutamyltransferase family protein n=1 Tax=Croceicoccus ponticola TaxID=2217664 RepID=A0A437GYB2_9SPHN|nr:gamma-glutamyltransferase family protein [Croceicoccus ponticola]RVQ67662.1 gamma-glutamyltransferase family protein [Croceicoccus ponticola]
MLKRFLLAFAAPMSLGACATIVAEPVADPAANIRPERGMVSAADPRAAQAGVAMLRAGGNATDAALATMIALTVVEPQSSGIGGGGFLVLDPEGDGDPTTYDGRETAPAAATPDWFLDAEGQPLAFRTAVESGLSVGVPGNIALAAKAHAEHGALPWAALFDPAIALARDGFVVGPRLRVSLDANRSTGGGMSVEARALFFGEDGEPVPVGTTLRNPALAAFLERVAAEGPQAFQTGANAIAIARTVEQHMPARRRPVSGTEGGVAVPLVKLPDAMTTDDIANYEAKERISRCGTYRAFLVCGMGPPSSGATTVFAILKQLEPVDMAAHRPENPVAWHLIAESMRLAFADRGRWLGDPDFVSVPTAGLMDGGYLLRRGAAIRADTTIARPEPGLPPGAGAIMGQSATQPENGTSHFVAVDGDGGVASYTSTVESAFGSGLMVNGYYLNNELTDFDFAPVSNGMLVANRVEPGKRPRSSMSPAIVYGPDGAFRLAIGAAGGATIIAQVAKALVGVIDWGLTAQAAIDLPVIFAPGDTVWVEQGTTLEAMIPALRALGHADVRARPPGFKANAVELVDGAYAGAADSRSEGMAVSE